MSNKYTMKFSIHFFVLVIFISKIQAQQDPHYTQYMYNTMSVNPAYAGSKDHVFITALARMQWLRLDGAPNTQNLSIDAPIGLGLGLGLNIVNDVLGPSKEILIDSNVSYTLEMANDTKLAFGLRLGGRILDIDWSRGDYYQKGDPKYQENIYKFMPIIGTGIYYYFPEKWYVGFSIPNLLRNESYDQYSSDIEVLSSDKMHLYMIAGYVFTINDNVKFKPAALVKAVSGAPLSTDVSANFYFYEKLNTGLSWRNGDSISVLAGFQATDSLLISYAYDLTTSNYRISNTGTHEFILQYQIFGVSGPRRLGCF